MTIRAWWAMIGALLMWPSVIVAQHTAGSARARGMADAFGAAARGAEAVTYNPANLGLRSNPKFSLALPAAVVGYGTAPIPLADLDRYGGQVVPEQVKAAWLAAIPEGGAFRGTVNANLTGVGVSVGRFGFAVGGVGHASMALPRSAAELLLYGNADFDGSFSGGSGRYFATSFVSAGGGFPLARLADGVLAIGGSIKYVQGHAFGSIWNLAGSVSGGDATTDIRFPAVTVGGGNRGIGADLGIAWESDRLSLGVAISDLVNTLAWSSRDARVRDGRALITADTIRMDFDDLALDDPALPSALALDARTRLEAAQISPTVRLSGAYRGTRVLLTADLLHYGGDQAALRSSQGTEIGVGGEYLPVSFLRLRAGAGIGDGGGRWTVGTGVLLNAFALEAAYGRHRLEGETLSLLSLGLTIGLR